MFTDDTNISIPGRTLADLEPLINSELANLNCWLKANRLSLDVAKTEFMIIGSRQRLLAESNDETCVSLENQQIERVNHTESFGVTIDDRLSWSNYINEVCKKLSSAIGALKRIRPFASQSTAIQIYNALIQPHLDYCSPVWDGLSNQMSDKLQKLQNRAGMYVCMYVCMHACMHASMYVCKLCVVPARSPLEHHLVQTKEKRRRASTNPSSPSSKTKNSIADICTSLVNWKGVAGGPQTPSGL